MKLALYQGPPAQGDPEAAFARLELQLHAAALAGARILVAPELFLPGYNQPELHKTAAQPLGGAWFQRLGAMARHADCGLTVGWAERAGAAVFNAATAFDRDGEMLGHYRKIQLFGPMEQASFQSGGSYCVFELDGVPTGLLICYDVEFAPHVWALAERGVKLLLVPTANPAGFGHVADSFIPARAGEMDMTIVYANYCGAEDDLRFGGDSLIAGPDSRIIARAGRSEALLIAENGPAPESALRSTQLSDFRKV
ncbi:carbon-nitrogen hydrolase family protein [Aliiruegeria lutimaris]|uniref:5-aminopentanamidase n=1 Tax=Aliiruegeria lutimaris TaxID=571298 RepID=A0A1G9IFC5_9RHOB|nr:carbon-nitrogen hydrolase family protein [Aliiruegeria lutimaris]SDL23968.1 5-aminopentanamidase [Aliiruegeria lutimaris]